MFKAFAFTFATVVLLGACRSIPAQGRPGAPVDLPPESSSQVRPLLDTQAFDPSEREAVSAVVAAVRQAGGSPSEQYVVGAVERSAGTLRIQVVHARDLGPECRYVLGDCSGWQRIYELNAETGQIEKVLNVQ